MDIARNRIEIPVGFEGDAAELTVDFITLNQLRHTVVVVPLSAAARPHPPVTIPVTCRAGSVFSWQEDRLAPVAPTHHVVVCFIRSASETSHFEVMVSAFRDRPPHCSLLGIQGPLPLQRAHLGRSDNRMSSPA